MSASLKKLAIQSALWTVVGYGGSQILRLANNLFLTRLLEPRLFGLMAIVNTLKMGLELLSDYGISQSIVNNKRGDEPEFLNTAWTLQILRGFQIWAISLLLTYPVAQIYLDEKDILYRLIPLIGFTSVIDGFRSTAMHTLQRRLEARRLMLYELALYALSFTILGVFCWFSPTIWSLAAGVVAGSCLHMLGSHYFLIPGYRNRWAWDRSAIQDIQTFGKWMAVASSLMFAAEQCDRFLLAKLLSFEKLGVYTVAYTIASVPKEVIRQLSGRVIFPVIAQQAELSRSELRAKIIKQRWLLLAALAFVLSLFVCGGDFLIALLYQSRNKHWEQYKEAMWMVPMLCCGMWFSVLFYTTSPALLAISKPLYSAQSNLARFITIAAGLPLAFSVYQILGAIAVIAFSDLPLYVVNLFAMKKEKLSCALQDLIMTGAYVLILVVMLSLRNALGFGTPFDLMRPS